MIRFIFIIAAIYFVTRFLKSFLKNSQSGNASLKDNSLVKIDDVMIKDPVCNVYFPKRDGVHVKIKGKHIYFCSSECKDTYMASKGN